MKTTHLISTLLLASVTSLPAYVLIDTGHLDIDVNYIGNQWEINLHHDDIGDVELSDGILYAKGEAFPNGSLIGARPAGAQWDFVGVNAGSPFYIFPQTQETSVLWPGFSTEGTHGVFASYVESDMRAGSSNAHPWITISLLGVTYTGDANPSEVNFSLWSTGAFGNPIVWMSTENGLTADDKFITSEGAHTHMNWGFSHTGYYEIDFEASGYLLSDPTTLISSGAHQLRIGVVAVPETSAYAAIIGVFAIAFMVFRHRR